MARSRLANHAAEATLAVGLFVVLAAAILTVDPAAQIGLLVGAAGTVAFFARPRVALLVVFVGRVLVDLMWQLPFNVGGLNIREAYGGGITVLAGLLLLLEIRRVDRHPALPPFVIYVVVMAIGAARNLEIRAAAEIAAKYVSPLLILFLVAAYYQTRDDRERFMKWTLLVFFVPVVLAMYHYFDGQMATYVRDGYNRLIGGYEHPHNHALMMVIIAASGVYWWFQETAWERKIAPTLLALCGAFALYNTYVRTGHLSFALFTVVFLMLTRRWRLVSAGLVAVALFVAVTPAMQDRFKDIVLFLVPNDDVIARHKLGSGRWGIWTSSIREYLDASPVDIVLGQGIGKHWILTRAAYNPYQLPTDFIRDAHSDYLSMTFQIGPIATFSYILMQIQVVLVSLRVRKYARTRRVSEFASFMVALMVGATVANIVSNSFINRVTQSWMLWAFSGLVFAEYFQLVREGLVPEALPVYERVRRRLARLAGPSRR